jgi:UDP-N-acetylmuramoyl-tripeptide--D-alanyl-D-alanine ligase
VAFTAFRRVALAAGLRVSVCHRRTLTATTFIGVTGSCGKTTTKELIWAALSAAYRGRRSPRSDNDLVTVCGTVLRTSRRDRFCVVEVAAWEPGSVARVAGVVRPQIAVVTNVGRDHHRAFRTLEATAAQKRALIDALPEDGTVVLNADDPNVLAMARGFGGRVVTFGRSPDAMVRGQDVSSSWPERLRFTVHLGGRQRAVATNLCGEHWVSSALAALTVAVEMGVPLDQAIEAIGTAPPPPGRMSPVPVNGATIIRDDRKAPLWAIDAALDVLAKGRAARKLAVIGTLSDYASPASRVYPSVARRALAIADEVVFVGHNARHAWAAASDDRLRAFTTADAAGAYLADSLRDGDLVLLKGSLSDRLELIVTRLEAREE